MIHWLIIGQSGMSLIGEIVIVLMALTVGSHGVVNGDWVGMGLFVL